MSQSCCRDVASAEVHQRADRRRIASGSRTGTVSHHQDDQDRIARSDVGHQCARRLALEAEGAVHRGGEAEVEVVDIGTTIGATGHAAIRLTAVRRQGDGGARAMAARVAVRLRGDDSATTALREAAEGGAARATLIRVTAATGATVATEAAEDGIEGLSARCDSLIHRKAHILGFSAALSQKAGRNAGFFGHCR